MRTVTSSPDPHRLGERLDVDFERYRRILATLAQTLVTEYDVAEVLHALCEEVVGLLRMDGAAVLLRDDEALRVAAAVSSEPGVPTWLEQREHAPHQRAQRTGEPVWVDDVAKATVGDGEAVVDEATAEEAAALGVVAWHAAPMRVHGHLIGAVTVWARHPAGLDEGSRDALITLAAAATAYTLNHQAYVEVSELAEQLQSALHTRVTIEQAKGMLAEQRGTGVDEAFEALRAYARRERRKLHDVAKAVVAGTLDLPS